MQKILVHTRGRASQQYPCERSVKWNVGFPCTHAPKSGAKEAPDANPAANQTPRQQTLLPVPLLGCGLVERLGAVTTLCMLDEDTVCKPSSAIKEVFLVDSKVRFRTQWYVEACGFVLPWSNAKPLMLVACFSINQVMRLRFVIRVPAVYLRDAG